MNEMDSLKKDEIRVLQVNLDDAGGAFSLIFQVQKQLNKRVVFDYYSMANFRKKAIVDQIESMGGRICEARLRSNRLIGHFILPFDFYKFLKENEYKIIHIHADTAWKLLLYSLPAKLGNARKIIVHAHSSSISGDYRLLKLICHYIAKPFLPNVSTTLLSCSDMASKWMYPTKYLNKVIKIHNGVDANKYKFNDDIRKKEREKLGIKPNEILIGTVGDFSYAKNPFILVDIFRILLNKMDNCKLIFVGDGPNRSQVEKYANKYGIMDKVIFLGMRFDVNCIYSALDVFVMPSRFEGLPMSALEAQANGLKCFLSDRISREVKILDNCQFIDIHNAYSIANSIYEYTKIYQNDNLDGKEKNSVSRMDGEIEIQKSKYNYLCTAKELLEQYRFKY